MSPPDDFALNPIIDQILTTRRIVDANGQSRSLECDITKAEGEYLHYLIRKHKISKSLEIGCAYGISSMFICDALRCCDNAQHFIIDPNQTAEFDNIGVLNLERLGISFYNLIERPSELALPKLVAENQQFELIFIDGVHRFDHVMLDFFYANRLLANGGIVVLDDCLLPGLKRAVSFIKTLPNFTFLGGVKEPFKRRPLRDLIDFSCSRSMDLIAFVKTDKDSRDWNWHKSF